MYMSYRLKYLKYKKKYLNLRNSLSGGIQLRDTEDVNYSHQYINEYDPKIFIDILTENNIQVPDHSDKINLFPSTAVHTSFEEVMELINKSCIDFINKVDKKETIMLIPILMKCLFWTYQVKFWFSLLYLNLLINEFEFPIKDVVLIGKTASQYFIDLIDKPISFNVLLCDDGSYSGQQIIDNILPTVLGTKLDKSIVCNKINKLHFCLPFCSKNM